MRALQSCLNGSATLMASSLELRFDSSRPGERDALARLPDVDDQELRSDEEDDQRLDDRGEVRRQLGIEDVRIELARRGSHLQSPEEERGEENADRLVAS